MIDTVEQTTCKVCGHPIPQKGGKGHRKREFCSPRCKQADYRARHGVTNDVTIGDDRQALDQKNIAVYQEKLRACAARIEKLERQVEVQRQRLSQSYQAKEHIAALEQELAEANGLIEKLTSKKSTTPLKKSYQERLTRKGEALDWPALEVHTTIKPGRKNWRVFMLNESNDQLIRAIIAAERIEEKHNQS